MNQVITLPEGLLVGQLAPKILRSDLADINERTGAVSGRVYGPPRWGFSLASSENLDMAQASIWEALMMDLKGALNVLAFYDIVRTAPRGTMRGTLTLSAPIAIGDESMVLAGASGTLLRGDWLQIGTGFTTSQTVKVRADATASAGTCTVHFAHPARKAYPAGTAVGWDKPLIYCRNMGPSGSWRYQAGNLLQDGFELDLTETFK